MANVPVLADLPHDDVAAAFGLGRPTQRPVLVQHTSFPVWRLTTAGGRYLVKRLWTGPDPDWWPSRAEGMAFERRVLAAGVATPEPVEPSTVLFGYAARVGDAVYRVHAWVDHRPLDAAADVTGWLAGTLAVLHGIQPDSRPGTEPSVEPLWWGLHDEATWLDWTDRARLHARPWAEPLAAALPALLELTERLCTLHRRAGDRVVTHGDVEPYNVLLTPSGPVLIDWDSVGPESATLEVGRAALAFGREDPARAAALLGGYLDRGGRLLDLGDDLFQRVTALRLLHLTERIQAALALGPVPGWMAADARAGRLDAVVADRIVSVPATAARLEALARVVSG